MSKQQKSKNLKSDQQANRQLNSAIAEWDNFSLAFLKGVSFEIRKNKNFDLINQKSKKDTYNQFLLAKQKKNYLLFKIK